MRCCIYARQSVTREGSESLDTQVAVCREAAERFGYEVVAVLVEPPSTSGYKNRGKDRLKFKELLAGFRERRWDMVIAYKTDRLSRGGMSGWAPLQEAIESAGLNVDKAVATPSGFISEFEIGIRATMDREESKKTSERLRDVNAAKAMRGLPHGSVRIFGYEPDLVTIRHDEAAIIRQLADLLLRGYSYYDLAAWLNQQDTGRRWDSRNVYRTLVRPHYAGLRIYKETTYPGTWPAIFSETEWERLQTAIKLRQSTNSKYASNSPKYLLTGLVYCGLCGEPMTGLARYDHHPGEGPKRRAYVCRKPQGDRYHGCGKIRRNADALEHFIKTSVLSRLDTPDLGALLSAQGDDKQLKILLHNRGAHVRKLDELVDDYATGLLDRAQLARAKATVEAELRSIEEQIASLTGYMKVQLPVGQTLREAWNSHPTSWQRALIGLVVKRIDVLPSRKSLPFYDVDGLRCRFDPANVVITWTA